MNQRQKQSNISDQILNTIKNEKPETVKQLIYLLQRKSDLSEEMITNHLLDLCDQGRLTLRDDIPLITITSVKTYILSKETYWYWVVLVLAITATSLALVSPNMFPFVYVRYVFGSIFTLFLPGYSFIQALFPERAPIPTQSEVLDTVERVALGIAVSYALVPMIGFLLNYTPYGIRTIPITISLFALTFSLATIALIRKYQINMQTEY